jgi:hypothetical protein
MLSKLKLLKWDKRHASSQTNGLRHSKLIIKIIITRHERKNGICAPTNSHTRYTARSPPWQIKLNITTRKTKITTQQPDHEDVLKQPELEILSAKLIQYKGEYIIIGELQKHR